MTLTRMSLTGLATISFCITICLGFQSTFIPSAAANKASLETSSNRNISAPTKKRDDYPEMPSQSYLGEETLNAVAEYVLSRKN